MLKIFFLTLFSLSLYAFHYPVPYSELAGPLFKARVELDPLVYQPSLRHHILAYEAHSDRVMGTYRLVKSSSPKAMKNSYHKALLELQKNHQELKRFLQQQLVQAIEEDNYPLFLAIVSTQNEESFKNPYFRENIYNYYSAHRSEAISIYLDNRIQRDWESIASYYPANGLVNYASLPEARYREVTLLTTSHSPYSAKVRAFLKNNRVKFAEYDIETSPEGKEIFEQHEGKRVPLVVINNRVIEGYNEFEMDRLLRR